MWLCSLLALCAWRVVLAVGASTVVLVVLPLMALATLEASMIHFDGVAKVQGEASEIPAGIGPR